MPRKRNKSRIGLYYDRSKESLRFTIGDSNEILTCGQVFKYISFAYPGTGYRLRTVLLTHLVTALASDDEQAFNHFVHRLSQVDIHYVNK